MPSRTSTPNSQQRENKSTFSPSLFFKRVFNKKKHQIVKSTSSHIEIKNYIENYEDNRNIEITIKTGEQVKTYKKIFRYVIAVMALVIFTSALIHLWRNPDLMDEFVKGLIKIFFDFIDILVNKLSI